jgi:hypothetical protein
MCRHVSVVVSCRYVATLTLSNGYMPGSSVVFSILCQDTFKSTPHISLGMRVGTDAQMKAYFNTRLLQVQAERNTLSRYAHTRHDTTAV